MGIQTATTNLIATRLWDITDTKASQEWTNNHHRTTQARAAIAVIVAGEVVEIYLLGAERVAILRQTLHLYAHSLQEVDELHNVEYLRDIAHYHLLLGKECGAENLQCLIFRTLWCYFAR